MRQARRVQWRTGRTVCFSALRLRRSVVPRGAVRAPTPRPLVPADRSAAIRGLAPDPRTTEEAYGHNGSARRLKPRFSACKHMPGAPAVAARVESGAMRAAWHGHLFPLFVEASFPLFGPLIPGCPHRLFPIIRTPYSR